MTFIEYLKSQGIDNSSPGAEGIVYAVIEAKSPDITYREASLIFVKHPTLSDMFEALWYGYETELDRQNYEREHKEPEDVYTITGRVLLSYIKEWEEKNANNTY